MTPAPLVQCNRLLFAYNGASDRMNFECSFPAGKTTTLLGPSGSGKSTLLNLIAGFDLPQSGNLLFDGVDMVAVPVAERPVSMVFQENNLFAHMSVLDNVALGAAPSLRLTGAQRNAVDEALGSVGLAGFEHRMPAQLSGGERQRVAIARVLVRHKPVLLLDEPFASLGPSLRADMLDLLGTIQAERSMTTVMVTHFPEDARRVSSHTVFLSGGHVVASGPTDAMLDTGTADSRVAEYLGHPDV